MACNDTKIKDLQTDMNVVVYHSAHDYHRITVDNIDPVTDGGIYEPCDEGSWVDPIDWLNSETTIFTEDTAGDCDEFLEIPDTCDDFGASYQLDGLDGGDFDGTGCTSCESSSHTAWDGAFDECMSTCCDIDPNNYYANFFGGLYAWDTISVGGKKIYYALCFFANSGGMAYYEVWIDCAYWDGGNYSSQTVWAGYKYCGIEPIGDYVTNNVGCDSTASVRVIPL